MTRPADIHNLISEMSAKGEPFVIATVVRTVSVTAAKAGAKAVIMADGAIYEGWIGGGCAKAAVIKAAKQAIKTGKPRLVSLLPEELAKDALQKDALQKDALQKDTLQKDTQQEDGVNIATNFCPSQGTMDIFVEPVLPPTGLLILGNSPVAASLKDLAPRFGFSCEHGQDWDREIIKREEPAAIIGFIVVSTQGNGDLKALERALCMGAEYVAFVGSKKKAASLCKKLLERNITERQLHKLKAPAGLDIGAITPDEIALSIVAEMVELRRRGQRIA